MSGSEALAICEHAECDIVLLDVMMPDMDGFEVCRRIKTNRATHHIPANVKLLEARLSAEYFDVVTAMSGSEALAICEHAECDIVLLDVMMPDMDGFEVCRRIKANRTTHHIPVVMGPALDAPSA